MKRSRVEERHHVIQKIEEHGPQIGVGMLRSFFPNLAKDEIRDVLERYRAHYFKERALVLEMLEMLECTTPGAVWAMDHTEPPEPVDGKHRSVLSVRDLSSGAQIVWKEELGPRAADVVRDLEEKFLLHGAPLVLKADNGSAFIAGELRDLCRRWGVELLWSPPRTPRYNGAIEAGIRCLKERTEHVALRSGRPGRWTAEDLQVALTLTNRLPKYARKNTTPRGEAFRAREPIAESVRAAFRSRLEEERAVERRGQGIAPETELERREQARIDRQAMRRALVALGILTITSRLVPLTLKTVFRAKVS